MQIFTGFFYLEKFFLKFFEVLEWYEGGVITTSPPPSFDNGVIPRGSNQTRLLSYIDKQIHSSKTSQCTGQLYTTMAQESQNVGIKNSWSLLDFARSHGKMKVTNDMTNTETGKTFKSCAFVSPSGAVTLVGFSSKLDTINPKADSKAISKQIAAQKDSLQVVELESGNYKLCKAGADSWEDVDLGL